MAGFTLVEVVCVLAILAALTAILLPLLPRATSRARLEAYAMQVATLLKRDRNTALQQGGPILTQVDAPARRISSGASDQVVRVADDVEVEALLPKICNGHRALSSIIFFPNGSSCGGVIRLSRPGSGFDVRVNWLTGGVEIVGHSIL